MNILQKLVEMTEHEQNEAERLEKLGGCLNLAARDRHIARSRAFLEVIQLIRYEEEADIAEMQRVNEGLRP